MLNEYLRHTVFGSLCHRGLAGPVGAGEASSQLEIWLAQVDKTTVVVHLSVTGASAKPNFNCMGEQGCLVCRFLGSLCISGFSTVPCSVKLANYCNKFERLGSSDVQTAERY